jgi:hypothetical protein
MDDESLFDDGGRFCYELETELSSLFPCRTIRIVPKNEAMHISLHGDMPTVITIEVVREGARQTGSVYCKWCVDVRTEDLAIDCRVVRDYAQKLREHVDEILLRVL